METVDIVNVISTVGFPIAACCAMFWLYTKMLPVITQLSDTMKDNQKMLEEVKVSLNLFNQNFTEIFRRLSVLEIEVSKDDVK